MTKEVDYLLKELKDPKKEIDLIRSGLKTTVVESFLDEMHLPVKDVLDRLDVSASTYFAKKKAHQVLDQHTSEKFIRVIAIMDLAMEVLGDEGREWMYRVIPTLGNEAPIDLLDTEAGRRLVEAALLQIRYGMYG